VIDIGINLINKRFPDIPEVIERAKFVDVKQMILTGTSLIASQKSLQWAQKYPKTFYATAGVHPHHAKDWDATVESQIKKIAAAPEIVAIGECGLDFDRDFSPRPVQESCFRAQLALAIDCQKPLFLHERAAFDRFVGIMTEYQGKLPKAVVHCFTGSVAEAKTYLDMGFYIGLTGAVTDERRFGHLKDVIKMIPTDRLMVETDAPFMLPKNIRNPPADRRNEPCYLPYIVRYIATHSQKSEKTIMENTTKVTKAFFGI
jgi:TatD DNase family protein